MSDKQYLVDAAKEVQRLLPDRHGFILFAVPIGDEDGRRLKYISDLQRTDAVNVLKEWLIKASGENEWMKHI